MIPIMLTGDLLNSRSKTGPEPFFRLGTRSAKSDLWPLLFYGAKSLSVIIIMLAGKLIKSSSSFMPIVLTEVKRLVTNLMKKWIAGSPLF